MSTVAAADSGAAIGLSGSGRTRRRHRAIAPARDERLADPQDRAAHDRPGDRQLRTCSSRTGRGAGSRRAASERRRRVGDAARTAEGRCLGRAPGRDHARVVRARGGAALGSHRRDTTSRARRPRPRPVRRYLEAGEERQVAAAKRLGAGAASVEPGEVDLHLVGGAGQRGERRERLAGQLGQLIDQRRQLRRPAAISTRAAAAATAARYRGCRSPCATRVP